MRQLLQLCILVSLLLWGLNGYSWSKHYLITRAILGTMPEVVRLSAPYENIEKALGDLDPPVENLAAFRQRLKIHPKTLFNMSLGEKEGTLISALDILAHYSDEPDWGMDRELFDVYKDVWRPEYAMMGGRVGLASQAFRHMYWPAFNFWHPLVTFKLPKMAPMGEAPQRAQIFFDLSRTLAKKNHLYWALRFLGNGLHYIEDVSQPFHASQTASKKFIFMALFPPHHFIAKVQNIVSYYHLAYEDTIGELLTLSESPQDNALSKRLTAALHIPASEVSGLDLKAVHSVAQLVIALANFSNLYSGLAGETAMKFFPPINLPYDQFDPEKVMDDRWKSVVKGYLNDASQAQVTENYISVVDKVFQNLSAAVRFAIETELPYLNGKNLNGKER